MAKYASKYYKRGRSGGRKSSKRTVRKTSLPYKSRARRAKLQHIRVKSLGNNTSFSKVVLRPNKLGAQMRKKYWMGARNIYVSDVLTTANVPSGVKQDWVETAYFSKVDMYQAVAQLANAPGATGSANNNSRYYFNKVIGEVVMTNSSNVNAEIDIYTFSVKHDNGVSVGGLFQQGMYDQTTQNLIDYSKYYAVSPLDLAGVSQMFKCYKVTHLQLNPGQSHRHSFTQHLCRPIGNEIIKNGQDNVLLGFRGITQYELFVVRSTSIASGADNVGEAIAQCRVNFNVNKKYELKYMFDNNTNMTLTYSVPSATNNQIYNQGSGSASAPVSI